jgi:hypothetical protein
MTRLNYAKIILIPKEEGAINLKKNQAYILDQL